MTDEGDLMQRKAHRIPKEPILRMKGITQSYFMYDSVQYKALRAIFMDCTASAGDGDRTAQNISQQ